MKKWMKIAIFSAAAVVAGAGIYFFFLHGHSFEGGYKTVRAASGDVSVAVSATGSVKAKEEVSYYIDTSQTVSSVPVREGYPVSRGDILVECDISDEKAELERRLKEAELNLENSRLNLESIVAPAGGNDLLQYESDLISADKSVADAENSLESLDIKISQQQMKIDDAKKNLDYYSELLESGAISQYEYDQAKLAYENVQKSMEDLNTQRRTAEDTLAVRKKQREFSSERYQNAKTAFPDRSTEIRYDLQKNVVALNEIEVERIRADLGKLAAKTVCTVDGYVVKVNVAAGQTASPSAAVILVADTSEITVQAEISEYDTHMLAEGLAAEITASGLAGKKLSGRVTHISAGAIKKDGSSDGDVVVLVDISVDNPGDMLKPGYSVDIDIFSERRENVLSLPSQAVFAEEGRYYVYLQNANRLQKTEIVIGFIGDKSIEILSGITGDDIVVAEPSEVPKGTH